MSERGNCLTEQNISQRTSSSSLDQRWPTSVLGRITFTIQKEGGQRIGLAFPQVDLPYLHTTKCTWIV